ncbi:MAG: LLM class flavin-dependent oxidoreductase [Alphaproteobacteria bacterium]|nr:LLM class flavin-dependent oxidoreductase [Alphaproteobacteria bacterium]
MTLGLFMMPYHDPRRDVHRALLDDVDTAVHADQVGFDEFWVGEHYSAPSEPITSPFIFLANLIARTKRIRLCTGVINLPNQHPAVVAAHAALLDHLAQGRFTFGISTGGLPSDFELFKRTDGAERASMMVESADMIARLWASDGPYELHGKHWDISLKDFVVPELGVGAILKPHQRPHPPMAVSAASPSSGSVRLAGARGWQFISAHFCTRASIKSHWAAYLAGCESAGRRPDPSAWRVARVIHVARDDAEARAYVEDPAGPYYDFWRYLLGLLRRAGQIGMLKTDKTLPDDAITPEYALREFAIYGSPARVAERLQSLRDEVGPFTGVVALAIEFGDRRRVLDSLSLLASEVRPALAWA